MKDGFDKSVAEKMPRMQKKRPNRPWNVDPVLLKNEEVQEPRQAHTAAVAEAVPTLTVAPESRHVDPSKAVESIIDLNADLSQMIFEKQEIRRQLRDHGKNLEGIERENAVLKNTLTELENSSADHKQLEKEIGFLNEQLDDADYYIQNMMGLLEERSKDLDSESQRRSQLEGKFASITSDIQEKAKLDVKVSILERDLNISTSRVFELETQLDEEYRKREPLEQEIVELKNALDRVYSSLAQVRLKAKREVYGS